MTSRTNLVCYRAGVPVCEDTFRVGLGLMHTLALSCRPRWRIAFES